MAPLLRELEIPAAASPAYHTHLPWCHPVAPLPEACRPRTLGL